MSSYYLGHVVAVARRDFSRIAALFTHPEKSDDDDDDTKTVCFCVVVVVAFFRPVRHKI